MRLGGGHGKGELVPSAAARPARAGVLGPTLGPRNRHFFRPETKKPPDSAPGETSARGSGQRNRPSALPKGFYFKKKARAPCGTRAKFGGGRSLRALSHSHLLSALAGWRAKCFPTLLTAASDAVGLIAGPSRPFREQDLSSEASTPGSVTTCRWFARRTGAGTPARIHSLRHLDHGDGHHFWRCVGPVRRV